MAGIVFWGINARIQTASAVKETTRELAIPAVAVIHPKPGVMKDEVVLPGDVQAFTDSPIYARSSGYLKQWNVDARSSTASRATFPLCPLATMHGVVGNEPRGRRRFSRHDRLCEITVRRPS